MLIPEQPPKITHLRVDFIQRDVEEGVVGVHFSSYQHRYRRNIPKFLSCNYSSKGSIWSKVHSCFGVRIELREQPRAHFQPSRHIFATLCTNRESKCRIEKLAAFSVGLPVLLNYFGHHSTVPKRVRTRIHPRWSHLDP